MLDQELRYSLCLHISIIFSWFIKNSAPPSAPNSVHLSILQQCILWSFRNETSLYCSIAQIRAPTLIHSSLSTTDIDRGHKWRLHSRRYFLINESQYCSRLVREKMCTYFHSIVNMTRFLESISKQLGVCLWRHITLITFARSDPPNIGQLHY